MVADDPDPCDPADQDPGQTNPGSTYNVAAAAAFVAECANCGQEICVCGSPDYDASEAQWRREVLGQGGADTGGAGDAAPGPIVRNDDDGSSDENVAGLLPNNLTPGDNAAMVADLEGRR